MRSAHKPFTRPIVLGENLLLTCVAETFSAHSAACHSFRVVRLNEFPFAACTHGKKIFSQVKSIMSEILGLIVRGKREMSVINVTKARLCTGNCTYCAQATSEYRKRCRMTQRLIEKPCTTIWDWSLTFLGNKACCNALILGVWSESTALAHPNERRL